MAKGLYLICYHEPDYNYTIKLELHKWLAHYCLFTFARKTLSDDKIKVQILNYLYDMGLHMWWFIKDDYTVCFSRYNPILLYCSNIKEFRKLLSRVDPDDITM